MAELERYLDFARQAAYEAGRLTLGYFYRGLEVLDKSDGSPVTVADREAEALLRKAIETAFPDHGIHGEEFGIKEPAAGCSWRWYIDPIDGTKSFIHGVPLYTNLLALVREEESMVGIIQLPALGEQLSAAKGMGAHLNGRRVQVSPVEKLDRAVVLCTDDRDLEARAVNPMWKKLWAGARFTRSWGDAYGHYLVATGRAEIMLDPIVEAYDVAPMPVILKEAGGAFFDWKGNDTFLGKNGISCSAKFAPVVRQMIGTKS